LGLGGFGANWLRLGRWCGGAWAGLFPFAAEAAGEFENDDGPSTTWAGDIPNRRRWSRSCGSFPAGQDKARARGWSMLATGGPGFVGPSEEEADLGPQSVAAPGEGDVPAGKGSPEAQPFGTVVPAPGRKTLHCSCTLCARIRRRETTPAMLSTAPRTLVQSGVDGWTSEFGRQPARRCSCPSRWAGSRTIGPSKLLTGLAGCR